MTPDLIYDQLIGAGCARKLVFSWGGNPGVGSLHRFRDAVEHGWPAPLELGGALARGDGGGVGGRRRQPALRRAARLRGDRSRRSDARRAASTCPFTGEQLAAVPALRPDVGIVHAQQADRHGNVQLWGIPGVQKEVVLASARSLVTVEEVVDELEPRPGAVVIPGWAITAVARGAAWRAAVVRARLLRARQRLLRRVGCDQPRPRHVRGVDAASTSTGRRMSVQREVGR